MSALVVWIPEKNETLSPLEGRLDVVATGPRNLPRDATTLWALMQRWWPTLQLRNGVTHQSVPYLQRYIDDRLLADDPGLLQDITSFDLKANCCRQ